MTAEPYQDPARYSRSAARVVCFLVLGSGVWCSTATIGSAVVAPATVIVAGKAKAVQHREGGVITAIKVREGDAVSAGAVVVELDDTQPRSEHAIQIGQLQAFVARRDRLVAERDNAVRMQRSTDPDTAGFDHAFSAIWEGERAQHEARRQSREGQKRQLAERVAQVEEQIEGRLAQLDARRRELETVRREVEELRPLQKRGLVTAQRFNTLERNLFSLEGEVGNTRASIAASRAQITEIRTQIANIDRDLATEVAKDLRETEDRIAEVREKIVATRERLARTRVRAPASGIVHQMTAGTVGGVATAGETLMQVVPIAERLLVEAKVERTDIDRAEKGQKVRLRFTSLDRRTTPELVGVVERVSADAETDQKSNASFYKVDVALEKSEVARLGGAALKPGMPAEAYLESGARTPFQYLFKPISDQLARAFQER